MANARKVLPLLGLLLLIASASSLLAAPAVAHSEEGLVSAEAIASGDDDRRVEVRARVTYLNDGDPAPGASVTVEGVGPSGEALPATPMAAEQPGIYATTVTVPSGGTWKFVVTSATPTGRAEVPFAVGVTPAPTTVPAAELDDVDLDVGTTTDDSNDWLLPAVGVLIVAILGGGAFAIMRRRHQQA